MQPNAQNRMQQPNMQQPQQQQQQNTGGSQFDNLSLADLLWSLYCTSIIPEILYMEIFLQIKSTFQSISRC